MYAQVSFLDLNHGAIVHVSAIKNFDPAVKVDPRKKYSVHYVPPKGSRLKNGFYKATIIQIGERKTLEDVAKMKRHRSVPKKLLESSSESSKRQSLGGSESCSSDESVTERPTQLSPSLLQKKKDRLEDLLCQRECERFEKSPIRTPPSIDLEVQLVNANSIISGLRTELQALQERLAVMEAELRRRPEVSSLDQLNRRLQMEILDRFNERQLPVVPVIPVIPPTQDGFEVAVFPAVGRVENDRVHLGRGHWISKAAYNLATNAKDPRQFTGNVAVALYTTATLMASSVTGRKSNSNKHSSAKPALDQTKMKAVQDILRYWMASNGETEWRQREEAELVRKYILRKIMYLNSGNTPSHIARKKTRRQNIDTDIEEEGVIDTAQDTFLPLAASTQFHLPPSQ